MEPFTIHCATCGSRIRVRNAALLGQLVNCPKCQAMVHVAPQEALPPNGSSGAAGQPRIEVGRAGKGADGGASDYTGAGQPRIEVGGTGAYVDSTALTHDGLAVDEYRLAPEEPLQTPPVQRGSLNTPDARQADSLAAQAWVGTDQSLLDQEPAHLPSAEWTSPSTTKKRQMLLVGFLGLAGIAVAVFLFFAFLQWHGRSVHEPENGVVELAAGGDPVDPIGAAGQQVALENPAAGDSSLESEPAADGKGREADETSTDEITSDSIPIKAVVPQVAADANGSVEATGGEGGTVDSAPLGQTTVDSGSADSRSTAEDKAHPDVDGEKGGEPEPMTMELPKRLEAFGPMLDYAIQPQFNDGVELLSEAPVTAEDLGLTTGQASAELPPVDLEKQAQVTLPALIIAPLPLSQFISVWSNVSGIPTVVNADSLAAAGIDRNQTLALSLVKSVPIGQLADRLGESLGIETISHDKGFLELAAPSETIEAHLPATFDVRGLVDDGPAEQWLKDTLLALFPEQTIEWRIEQGKLTRPQVDALVWFSVVRLLDGWRVAAGLASALPEYEPALLASELVPPSEVAGLDHVLKVIQAESRPISQSLPRLCRAAGMHAWLDWPHLASLGVGPQTMALVVTSERPLRRALADYVSEFPMVVAVLDRQSLWLTSNAAYRASPRHYVIPSAGDDAEQWSSRLRPLTPAAVAMEGGASEGVASEGVASEGVASEGVASEGVASEGVGSVVVIATPDGRFMLVRCCPMTVSFP